MWAPWSHPQFCFHDVLFHSYCQCWRSLLPPTDSTMSFISVSSPSISFAMWLSEEAVTSCTINRFPHCVCYPAPVSFPDLLIHRFLFSSLNGDSVAQFSSSILCRHQWMNVCCLLVIILAVIHASDPYSSTVLKHLPEQHFLYPTNGLRKVVSAGPVDESDISPCWLQQMFTEVNHCLHF